MEQTSPGSVSEPGRLFHDRRAGPGHRRCRRHRLWGTRMATSGAGPDRPKGPRSLPDGVRIMPENALVPGNQSHATECVSRWISVATGETSRGVPGTPGRTA